MQEQFENLTATELYCPRCKTSQPVRERLLLVLPHAEVYDYRCTACGTSLGSREVKSNPLMAAHQAAARARQAAAAGAAMPRKPRALHK